MKKVISIILWIAVVSLITYTMLHLHDKDIQTETKVKVTHDTIVVSKPIVKDSVLVRTDTIKLPIVRHIVSTDTIYKDIVRVDSVEVEIPIERKTYEDSVYFAVVSGYRVNLDSIRVNQRNMIVERYIKSTPKRFGIGIIGGYGLSKDGVSPFIGVGVSYNLWQF